MHSDEKLCQLAAGNGVVHLWGVKWLQVRYQRAITRTSIFNNAVYDSMNDVPQPREVKIFTY